MSHTHTLKSILHGNINYKAIFFFMVTLIGKLLSASESLF